MEGRGKNQAELYSTNIDGIQGRTVDTWLWHTKKLKKRKKEKMKKEEEEEKERSSDVLRSNNAFSDQGAHAGTLSVSPWSCSLSHPHAILRIPDKRSSINDSNVKSANKQCQNIKIRQN